MNKFKTIIKENIHSQVKKIMNENNDNVMDEAKREFIEAFQNNAPTFIVGKGDVEIPSANFTFYVDYILQSEAYYEDNPGSYDEAPWGETYNEDKFEFTYFNVTAIDEETNMELTFVPDDGMFEIIKPLIVVDYSSDGDMPSKEEYYEQY